MSLFGFLALGFVVSVSSADVSRCPLNVQSFSYLHAYLDSCVLFVRPKQSWQDARNYCKRLGGDLVTIKDASKQQFILKYLSVDHWDTDNVWIGLTDQAREGDWRWVDGSRITYSRFADGQGNNHNTGFLLANGGSEDCALIRRDDGGRWHDYHCAPVLGIGFQYSYACEFPMIKLTSTAHPVTFPPTTIVTTTSKSMPSTTTLETPYPTTLRTTMANVETPRPTTMANVETPRPTTMANVETPRPTTMANVETPRPTTMANVETPRPTTTMANVETPRPTTIMANVETPRPTTMANVETPRPTQPNMETPAPTPAIIIGRRRRRGT